MIVNGFLKTTLLDYPGHLASTVFLGKCNFRCPFCHNSMLVLEPQNAEQIDFETVLSHLNKRKNILEGVCITGGEPTLNPKLTDLIRAIKDVGLLVKLDTNGYRPDILEKLFDDNLIDHIAMDIKSSRNNYHIACGLNNIDIGIISKSINLIKEKSPSYEFRTTLVKGIHTDDDLLDIADWIGNVNLYFLQNYTDSENVMKRIFSAFSDEEMHHFKELIIDKVPNTKIRGESC